MKDKVKWLSIDKVRCYYFDEGRLQVIDRCEGPQNYDRPLETDKHL